MAGPGAPATQLSGASARTGQSNEARTDIDVDVVHVVVRHDAARVVIGDQPSDDLGLFAPYAGNRSPGRKHASMVFWCLR